MNDEFETETKIDNEPMTEEEIEFWQRVRARQNAKTRDLRPIHERFDPGGES